MESSSGDAFETRITHASGEYHACVTRVFAMQRMMVDAFMIQYQCCIGTVSQMYHYQPEDVSSDLEKIRLRYSITNVSVLYFNRIIIT